MAYGFQIFGSWNVLVSIYQADGTVAVSHGGIEMGQGINTKVAQVCAYALGIPLETVSVKPSNNLVAPNAMFSGGSITSEAVCFVSCSVIISKRLLYKISSGSATSLPTVTRQDQTLQRNNAESNLAAVDQKMLRGIRRSNSHVYVIFTTKN